MHVGWEQNSRLGNIPGKRALPAGAGLAIAGLISLLMWAVIVLIAVAI